MAAWILAQGLSAERPLVILSDNSVEHALFALAAQHVGVPSAAISPAYSLMSKDFDKLRSMVSLLEPGAIYVSAMQPFAAALAAIQPLHSATIVSGNAADTGAISFRTIAATLETPDVAKAFAAVTPDTIAKFLFTSGSTGTPKAVINTQRMLTSSQQAKAQTWSFLEGSGDGLVILDWLPWSHTFGANHNFNLVLRNGGTLFVDGGKPAPGLFATSLANLRSVMPTVYFNVPRGFDMLIAALRSDDELRRRFFSEVKFAFYAGAALPQNLWDALEELSIKTVGRALPMVSAWGSTETSPLATDCHFQAQRSGNIGVPIPGTELKLVPSGDKLEVRVRGPNVTPGYWKAPELTAQAFDAEGFYLIGDAVTFADPARPELGLFFDGRVAEDFKLNSGTWVSVGTLRVAGIAALAPLAQDIVVTGHGGDEVRFLVFPNIAACRAHAGLTDSADVKDVIGHDKVRHSIAQGLAKLKAQSGNSSGHATRALLLAEPASVDGGEITDKGYINQRAVLTRRAQAVATLDDDGFRRMDRLRRVRRGTSDLARHAGTSPAMTKSKSFALTNLLPKQLTCESFRAIARFTDRAVELPCRAGRKRMLERSGPSGPNARAHQAGWNAGARLAVVAVARSGAALAGHGAEILVQPPQQVDQNLPLVFLQAGQQPPLAFERGHDHLVVDRAPARGQRDGVGAAVVGCGADRDQAALLQHRKIAADRPLVEADHVADPRGRNAGLDRQQRHDPPFRDVDAEIALIKHRRAVRQLVGDEGDERRNVAVEIEQRAVIGGCGLHWARPARFPAKGNLAHVSIIAAELRPSNRDMGQGFTRTNFGRSR